MAISRERGSMTARSIAYLAIAKRLHAFTHAAIVQALKHGQ
jgi:hypothetical protein